MSIHLTAFSLSILSLNFAAATPANAFVKNGLVKTVQCSFTNGTHTAYFTGLEAKVGLVTQVANPSIFNQDRELLINLSGQVNPIALPEWAIDPKTGKRYVGFVLENSSYRYVVNFARSWATSFGTFAAKMSIDQKKQTIFYAEGVCRRVNN